MINLCKFPQRHNTIKVSYSCIPNTQTKAQIHKYNKNAVEEAQQLNKNYSKQCLKFAVGTTKNCLQSKIIKTIRNYPRRIRRFNSRVEYS